MMKIHSLFVFPFLLLFGGVALVAATATVDEDVNGKVGGGGRIRGLSPLFSPPTAWAPTITPAPMAITPTTEPQGEWKKILHDRFEGGSLGNFEVSHQGGHVKVIKYDDNPTYNGKRIYKGSGALRLSYNGEVEYKGRKRVAGYDHLRLRMRIYTHDFDEDDNDRLRVQYSDEPGSFETLQSMHLSNDWLKNEEFVEAIVDGFNSSSRNVKIRLRCDANDDRYDDREVYIDEVILEGYKTIDTPWNVVTYDDFENGWGNFADADNADADDREDARRVSDPDSDDSDYVPQGNAALRIRDDSGRESSVFHEIGHDVTGYSRCRVSFSFCARGIEGNEGFELQYSYGNGSGWTTIKEYIKGGGRDSKSKFYFWNNDQEQSVKTVGGWTYETVAVGRCYSDTVVMKDEDYNLNTTKARIRFRSDASGDNDYIYIDDVTFECRE